MELRSDFVFSGYDLSLNHGAIVSLDERGSILRYGHFSIAAQEVEDKHGFRLKIPSSIDPPGRALYRQAFVRRFVLSELSALSTESDRTNFYGCVEDYAYAEKFQAHQLGEVVGIAKRELFREGLSLRLHEPGTVKAFATGNYQADKEMMVSALEVYEDLGHVKGLPKNRRAPKTDKLFSSFTDIADAYFLARLVFTEHQLRLGKLQLEQLTQGQRQIFLRTTKKYPVNILDRPFTRRDPQMESAILSVLSLD